MHVSRPELPSTHTRSVAFHATLTALLVVVYVATLAPGDASVQHGLLIAAAALAMKKFGHKSDDADDDVQGKHPVTRFLFRAANTGVYDDVEDAIGEDFTAYANGYSMLSEETDRGPELFVDLFDYWRGAVSDVRWELYDEVAGKQEDKSELVSIRLVAHGATDGAVHDIEIAAFVRVVDKKLVELRLVTDMTVFNEYRAAIGLPILD